MHGQDDNCLEQYKGTPKQNWQIHSYKGNKITICSKEIECEGVDWMHVAQQEKKTKTKLNSKNLRSCMRDFDDKSISMGWMKKLCRYTQ